MDGNKHSQGIASASVIICAYTEARWDELVKAIESLTEQSPASEEIILVIDHNPQLLWRAERAFPNVQVIPNQETRGLSGARNSGVKAAHGDVLVFMDEDAWPEPGWLARLLDPYSNPDVLGAGGAIEPEWDNGRPAWFPAEFDWVVGCTYQGMPTQTSPVRNLIGANMSFRRSVFSAAGGFHPAIGRVGNFPAGGEETEFSIRLRKRSPNGLLLYIPEARVYHRVPLSRSRWSYFASRCYIEGQSKALIARLVGAQDGLGSERFYTLRTLPVGILRGLGQALRGDIHGLQRAAVIIAGLGLTTAGYLAGKLRLLTDAKTVADQGLLRQSKPQPSPMQQLPEKEGSSSGRIRGQ